MDEAPNNPNKWTKPKFIAAMLVGTIIFNLLILLITIQNLSETKKLKSRAAEIPTPVYQETKPTYRSWRMNSVKIVDLATDPVLARPMTRWLSPLEFSSIPDLEKAPWSQFPTLIREVAENEEVDFTVNISLLEKLTRKDYQYGESEPQKANYQMRVQRNKSNNEYTISLSRIDVTSKQIVFSVSEPLMSSRPRSESEPMYHGQMAGDEITRVYYQNSNNVLWFDTDIFPFVSAEKSSGTTTEKPETLLFHIYNYEWAQDWWKTINTTYGSQWLLISIRSNLNVPLTQLSPSATPILNPSPLPISPTLTPIAPPRV